MNTARITMFHSTVQLSVVSEHSILLRLTVMQIHQHEQPIQTRLACANADNDLVLQLLCAVIQQA